jgi:hypothetical protein
VRRSDARRELRDGVLEVRGHTLLRNLAERTRRQRASHHVLLLMNRKKISAAVEPASLSNEATSKPFKPASKRLAQPHLRQRRRSIDSRAAVHGSVDDRADAFSTAAAPTSVASLSPVGRTRGRAPRDFFAFDRRHEFRARTLPFRPNWIPVTQRRTDSRISGGRRLWPLVGFGRATRDDHRLAV